MRFEPGYLAHKSAKLESASPEQILEFAFERYGSNLAISTAFGLEGCALIDMAWRVDANVRVFTVDTGYLYDESHELKRTFLSRYGLRLTTFMPQQSTAEQDAQYGAKLHDRDPDSCCAMRKIEPTRRALHGLDAWIAGLRRDQGPSRRGIQILERHNHDDGSPLVKIHPLANWPRAEVWRYVNDHHVPYNALLDRGYDSIGCTPCTDPTAPGAAERSGRWGGQKTECGIHTFSIRLPGGKRRA